ncbi:ATP-binding protein [Micromonospora sp. NBC_01655]|uniref:ATP-binding protein n=1 Tax=Micromonospora sp. NBC_01655 TaxID=2975983 RepID=UPI00224EE620|nr:ATP-binding protein [Micromonospora sp. NBC_01655]MCX4472481.1 ATP-binding protein [Micromonospora sp. NBC_01655]
MGDDRQLHERDGGARGPATFELALMSQDFTAATVTEVRHAVEALVSAAGMPEGAGYNFVLAVHELVANAVRHGGGHGHVELRRRDDVLVCEVSDQGAAAGSMQVRLPAADVAGGRGLWLADELTGGLTLNRRPDGMTASVTAYLSRRAMPRAERVDASEAHLTEQAEDDEK